MSRVEMCWNTENPLYIKYHDEEWGVPLHDDNKLFEFLSLGGFQAGLSWWIILQKRESFRIAFNNFELEKVAAYTSSDIERLMNTRGIIRNKMKISSVINNAKKIVEIQSQFDSFNKFVWQFVNNITISNSYSRLSELPSETNESNVMSKELQKKGLKFVGPTICYAFMQAVGMVNDHLTLCFRYKEINQQIKK